MVDLGLVSGSQGGEEKISMAKREVRVLDVHSKRVGAPG